MGVEIEVSDEGSDIDENEDFADISEFEEMKASAEDLNDLNKLIYTTREKAEGIKIILLHYFNVL